MFIVHAYVLIHGVAYSTTGTSYRADSHMKLHFYRPRLLNVNFTYLRGAPPGTAWSAYRKHSSNRLFRRVVDGRRETVHRQQCDDSLRIDSDRNHPGPLASYTMGQPQINLYIDCISPFGYLAFYMLRVSRPCFLHVMSCCVPILLALHHVLQPQPGQSTLFS